MQQLMVAAVAVVAVMGVGFQAGVWWENVITETHLAVDAELRRACTEMSDETRRWLDEHERMTAPPRPPRVADVDE